MPQRAYITMLGRSVWALVNSYCAVLNEVKYYPDSVYVFSEEAYKGELERAAKAVEILSAEFGFAPSINCEMVQEANFYDAGMKISSRVKELKAKGFEIALDVTPGRKALVAGSLVSLSKIGVDHMFYLKINSLDGASRPYFMIPLQTQKLHDFIEDAKRCTT